jgi:hypothetical protein
LIPFSSSADLVAGINQDFKAQPYTKITMEQNFRNVRDCVLEKKSDDVCNRTVNDETFQSIKKTLLAGMGTCMLIGDKFKCIGRTPGGTGEWTSKKMCQIVCELMP